MRRVFSSVSTNTNSLCLNIKHGNFRPDVQRLQLLKVLYEDQIPLLEVNKVLVALQKSKEKHLGSAILNKLQSCHLLTNSQTLISAMKAAYACKLPEQILHLWDNSKSSTGLLNAKHLTILLDSCENFGMAEEGIERFVEHFDISNNQSNNSVPMDAIVANSAIKLYATMNPKTDNLMDDAVKVLAIMKQRDIQPNPSTYASLLKIAHKLNHHEMIERLREEMKEHDIAESSITTSSGHPVLVQRYDEIVNNNADLRMDFATTVMSACCHDGMYEKGLQVAEHWLSSKGATDWVFCRLALKLCHLSEVTAAAATDNTNNKTVSEHTQNATAIARSRRAVAQQIQHLVTGRLTAVTGQDSKVPVDIVTSLAGHLAAHGYMEHCVQALSKAGASSAQQLELLESAACTMRQHHWRSWRAVSSLSERVRLMFNDKSSGVTTRLVDELECVSLVGVLASGNAERAIAMIQSHSDDLSDYLASSEEEEEGASAAQDSDRVLSSAMVQALRPAASSAVMRAGLEQVMLATMQRPVVPGSVVVLLLLCCSDDQHLAKCAALLSRHCHWLARGDVTDSGLAEESSSTKHAQVLAASPALQLAVLSLRHRLRDPADKALINLIAHGAC